MKEVIIAVLWLVIGIINYKVFEEDVMIIPREKHHQIQI